MTAAHAAVVLAAGGSRRLGQPKALLARDGETLVHRAARLCQATDPCRLLVIAGAHAHDISHALADLRAEAAINPDWEAGLSTTLQCAAALLHAHEGPVLIVGCDQPALELLHLHRLLEGAANAASRMAATLHGECLGPPAVISPALLQRAHALSADRGFGAHLNALPPDAVWTLHAPELQLDIDTREDCHLAVGRGLLDGL